MNKVKMNNKIYFYESFWRLSRTAKITDSDNKLFPYPKERSISWQNKESFYNKLIKTETNLKNNKKFVKYKSSEHKSCYICGKKNISTGIFTINNIRRPNG